MGTEILKSFGTLQSELEQARTSLKYVDESIKRLIGRDPSELAPRPPLKRGGAPLEENRNSGRQRAPVNVRPRNHENDEPPPVKRRNGSVFKRLSERPVHYEEEVAAQPQRQLISKVIVTPKEVPSREEALAAQNTDEKAKARNRRMFGALLGTLQKFQQEETKLKQKEDMRAQLEKKIEEHEIKEKAEIKKERQELFFNRKKKQAEIKMIELKMLRMKEYAAWEERQKPRMNFIQTKATPYISYLPRKLNDVTKALLEECKKDVETMLENKRQEVSDELQHIEDRMKRNFEPRKDDAEKETPIEETTEENHDDQPTQPEHQETVPENVSSTVAEEASVVPDEQKMEEEEKENQENVAEEKSTENTEEPAKEEVEPSVTSEEKTVESEETTEKMEVQ